MSEDAASPRLARWLPAGIANALTTLTVLLTLGLLAFAALGPAGVGVGIRAAFAAVVAGGLVYALLGSSVSPAGAPSTATALILAGLVAQVAADPGLDLASADGVRALLAVVGCSVVLMGALQVAMGLLGLGRLARFVPQPVLAGFMNGVALMILVSQVPPLLGLPARMPFADITMAQVQPLALVAGTATAAMVWAVSWRWPRLPAALLALVAGSALCAMAAAAVPSLAALPMVGELPRGVVLPDALRGLADEPALALLRRQALPVVLTAGVLAVIGSLESLLSAVAVDQLAHARHDTRRELVALGLANVASGACGGLAIVLMRLRAVPLVDAGVTGRLPVLAATAALAGIFAFGGPLLAGVPKAVLAGLMVTIAVALVDRWTHQLLRQLGQGERSPDLRESLAAVALVCAATIGLGFVAGVAVGIVLSMVTFIRSLHRSLIRARYTAARRPSRRLYGPAEESRLAGLRDRVTVLELEGALFFGSAERLSDAALAVPAGCRCLVIDLGRVSTLDESGAVTLQQLSRQLRERGVTLRLAGVAEDNAHGLRLRAFGCFRDGPREDWHPDADHAVEAAERDLLREAGGAGPQDGLALAETSLFRGLDPGQRDRLHALMPAHRLPAGTHLFRAGDPGDRLFVLTHGSISIRGPADGPVRRFGSFSPGVMFGEIAVLDGGGRTADAVADTEAVVHALSRESLEALAATEPALGERLARNIALHLADRLRRATAA